MLFCCLSYHGLLELHYTDKWHKSVAAKELAQEVGIPVWEAECCLDTDLFLDEYPQWGADSPQHPIHPAEDVHACWSSRAERVWMSSLLISSLTLGCMLRWRFPPSSWWGLGLPGRRHGGSTMICISWGGYQDPTIWARANGGLWLGDLHCPRRTNVAKVGFHPAERRARMRCCGYFAAQTSNWNPS